LRDDSEITQYKNNQIAPKTSKALNPSFDITSSSLITGIICEKGIIKPYYNLNIQKFIKGN